MGKGTWEKGSNNINIKKHQLYIDVFLFNIVYNLMFYSLFIYLLISILN